MSRTRCRCDELRFGLHHDISRREVRHGAEVLASADSGTMIVLELSTPAVPSAIAIRGVTASRRHNVASELASVEWCTETAGIQIFDLFRHTGHVPEDVS